MDNNLKWLKEKRINNTIEALKKNGMNGYLVKDREELISKIVELTKEGDTVTCGGSMSLFETGVIDHLRSGRYNFLDRYAEGLSQDEIKEIYRGAFSADVYFAGTNAVTENGELYNVDGTGNRVAAMLFGPDKVILVVGENKIVKNLEEAILRNERICAPVNCERLNRATPCVKVGHCMDCSSPERICNEYIVIKKQRDKDRIHVIFMNESLGY
ncbi:MAG: lactate utilization protein [Clostridium sp.]|uniref:lactate utilization protein n=1 Tax=Clostridium culturomicium TaxID=1499683 RepID=UPI00058B0CE0|nr:lactate utilization protein [Clostridium culturomicium]MDU4891514.1 lactate utilization protein [Clostridium sp.]MDU7085845.1 lactate utilization protein [Clostridium sp.]